MYAFKFPPETYELKSESLPGCKMSLKCCTFVSKHTEQNSPTKAGKVCTVKLLKKKHKHTLAGNYYSCITTIYGNNCRLQVLYDIVVSVSGELRQNWTALLQSMYSDMHIKHQHLQYVVVRVLKVSWVELSLQRATVFQEVFQHKNMCVCLRNRANVKATLLSHVSMFLIQYSPLWRQTQVWDALLIWSQT